MPEEGDTVTPLVLGEIRGPDRFERSDTHVQREKFMRDPIQELRRKMQPGSRRRYRPRLRSEDGLIPFTIDSLRHPGEIRRKRYFPDFVQINRSIESDHSIACIADLHDFADMAMDRKCSSQGK